MAGGALDPAPGLGRVFNRHAHISSDATVPGEAVQALTTENTTLKQLTREHRALQERLEGARSNLRFANKRVADLEAQLLERNLP